MKTRFTFSMTVFSLLAAMLFAAGCKKTTAPKVAMVESSAVLGYDKAVVGAQVVDDGHGTITERGFCYGKPGETPDTLLCNGSENPFSVELLDLLPTTEYSCKAFAVNEAGRGSSEAFVFTTLDLPGLEVKTYDLTDLTYNSAEAHGRVENIGGPTVLECGVCYSTEENPTIDDMRVVADVTIGSFDCPLRDLTAETWYYLRAYAVCPEGPRYGREKSFLTDVLPLEVKTLAISDVTATRARVEGMVVRDGGYEVLEKGFCWGTEHNPTMDDLYSKAGIGMGSFNSYISGFERGRVHYVRAYAINEKGVAYGEEVEFVPDDMSTPWPEGTLPGVFSVSPDRRVRFSQGNLQFYPDENLWRFAERQWDFVGGQVEDPEIGSVIIGTVYANGAKCNNDKTWKYYEGWMDLFGWGTSGWNNGNEYYHPYDFAACPYHCASYGPAGNYDLTGDYVESDWGVHNTISNGGSRQWYTPSSEELVYLISERETPSGMRFAKAVVAGVSGMILLPDDWDASTYYLNAVNEHSYFVFNKITGRDWLEVLEPAGAVFLPAAGERYQVPLSNDIIYDNMLYNSGTYPGNGSYWTTTQSGVCIAYALVISNYELGGWFFEAGCMGVESSRQNGRSVRLISVE
jgi:hypothetical protein